MNPCDWRNLRVLTLTATVGLLSPALIAGSEGLYEHHGNEHPILWTGKSPWDPADPATWPGDVSLIPSSMDPDDGDSLFPPDPSVDLGGLIGPAPFGDLPSLPAPEVIRPVADGAAIPAPGVLPLLVVAGLAVRRRRRG